jgi:hypothetical protein
LKSDKGGVTSVTALHIWINNAASILVETLVLTSVLEKQCIKKKKTKRDSSYSALAALIIFSFCHLAGLLLGELLGEALGTLLEALGDELGEILGY